MTELRQARIHLDHINGAPLLPEVRSAMAEVLDRLANPSGLHAEGRIAAQARDAARAQVAALIGTRSEEVVFTSCGTEANVWALTHLAEARRDRGRQVVLSSVEHLSLLQTARRMEKEGWRVTLLPVDRRGRVDPAALDRVLTSETVLVSVQWANAEVGTLQPMEEIARRAKSRGVLVHSDAVAAAGQVPVDLRKIPVDAVSLAAHPMGGPPGIGALVLRKGTRIAPWFLGGGQEEGRRAGTENLLGVVGMGRAAEVVLKEREGWAGRITPLRDRLIRGILDRVPEATLHGHPTERLPGHASFSIPGTDAEELVLALDMQAVAVGIGSACTSGARKASHVLKAMGVEESCAMGAVTCTLGGRTSQAEVDRVVDLFPRVAARLKEGRVR